MLGCLSPATPHRASTRRRVRRILIVATLAAIALAATLVVAFELWAARDSEPARSTGRLVAKIDACPSCQRGHGYGRFVVEEARRAGLRLPLAAALVHEESNYRNVFGKNRYGERTNPVLGGPVTEARYRQMRRALARGYGRQGVGPTQLTSVELQDEADALGGAWVPRHNIRVGYRYLSDLIDRHGETKGLLVYNGDLPDYASRLQATARSWEDYLAGKSSRPFPARERRLRALWGWIWD